MKKILSSSKMFKGIISFLLFLLFSFIGYSQTIYFSGIISSDTTLSADTVKITDHVVINDGATLSLNSGTYVEFQSNFSIVIYGRILAIGNLSDSITFTIKDSTGFANLGNTLGGWAGIWLYGFPPTDDSSIFEYCKFSYCKNTALNINNGQLIRIENCLINDNYTAIGFDYNISALVKNNYFRNNYTALFVADNSDPIISGNIFQNNQYGIIVINSSARIINNVISHSTFYGIQINDTSSASVTITQNEITYNRIGIFINGAYNSNILINKNIINYNNNISTCSGIYILEATPTIINNTIAYNSSMGGSGIFIVKNSTPLIMFNKICNNYASGLNCGSTDGGAGILSLKSSPFIINNLICNNEAEYVGGGISILDTSFITLANNTIVNNRSNQNGGGGISISMDGGDAVIKNNIVFGNEVTQIYGGESSQISAATGGPPFDISYCDFSDTLGYISAYFHDLILSNPLFVNPTAGAGISYDALSADWSLQSSSPCNNTGTPDTTGLHLYTADIIGNSRVKFGRIDIGAYESLNYVPVVTANSTSESICEGSSVILTGGGATTYTWSGGVIDSVSFVPSSTMTYTVTGTDVNGFSSTATKIITILPTSSSDQTLTLCAGQSISVGSIAHNVTGTYIDVLSALNGCDSIVTTHLIIIPSTINPSVMVAENILTAYDSTISYQWIDCNNDNVPIEGAIYQTYIAIESGSYAVVLSNGECVDTSICNTLFLSGITNLFNVKSISISPNPVIDKLFIKTEEKINTIKCLNYLGQSVELKLENNSINTSALSDGMYFLVITTLSGQTVCKRFIKE